LGGRGPYQKAAAAVAAVAASLLQRQGTHPLETWLLVFGLCAEVPTGMRGSCVEAAKRRACCSSGTLWSRLAVCVCESWVPQLRQLAVKDGILYSTPRQWICGSRCLQGSDWLVCQSSPLGLTAYGRGFGRCLPVLHTMYAMCMCLRMCCAGVVLCCSRAALSAQDVGTWYSPHLSHKARAGI
jgi:hypothetical protein